jgi:hypothetical protein
MTRVALAGALAAMAVFTLLAAPAPVLFAQEDLPWNRGQGNEPEYPEGHDGPAGTPLPPIDQSVLPDDGKDESAAPGIGIDPGEPVPQPPPPLPDAAGIPAPDGGAAHLPAERSTLPPLDPPPAPAAVPAANAPLDPPMPPPPPQAGAPAAAPADAGSTTPTAPSALPGGWTVSPRAPEPAGRADLPPPQPNAPQPAAPSATPGPPTPTAVVPVPAPPAASTALPPKPDDRGTAGLSPVPAGPNATPGAAQPAAAAPPGLAAPEAPPAAPAGPLAAPGVAPLPDTAAIIPLEKVEIKWRVENPFRFFGDPKDTNVHRATYLALSPDERQNPVLSAERALAARHPEGWAATMFRKTCWNRSRNEFACADDSDYINPDKHSVVVELAGANDPAVNCIWRVNLRGDGKSRADAVTKPCSETLVVDVPYPDGAAIMVEIAGRPVAQADVKVRDLLVAGMGDSFASGEGNPDGPVRFSRERTAAYGGSGKDLLGYPARVGSWKTIGDKAFIEENARWLDQACHRSLYSFELRAALQLALEDPHRAVTYVGVACSGAEVTAGLFLRYKGNEWVPNPPALSQISAIAQAQCGRQDAPAQDLPEAYHMQGAIKDLQGGLVLRKCAIEKARKIDLLFVSIGGNDIGFSRLLANAVLAEKSLLKKLGGWFGEVEGQVEASRALEFVGQRYKSFNRALHNILHVPWNETDRVILTAYPPLALLGDGSATCPDGTAGMDVLSDFRLSEKRARAGTWVADKLHRVMADSAQSYGWTFADAHRQAFVGRGICAGYTDNAFSIADDLRLPRNVEGKWVPYNPADFRAYAPRQRWFRTPNDAFMTGNFHVSGSMLQKALKLESLSWFQLLLASTYSGAFHPTAEGHAAIADSVVTKARDVLRKYKQESPEVAEEAKAASSGRLPTPQ